MSKLLPLNLKMKINNIKINTSKILVVGPIYNQIDKLFQISQLHNIEIPIIFLGDLCYPYDNYSEIPERLSVLKAFMENKKSYYIIGDKDLIYMKKIYNSHADVYDWFKQQNLAIKFNFLNNSSVMVTHGGILPKHKTLNDLNNDLEICFVKDLPDSKENWHTSYDGRFGYIISSHPNSITGEFYNYSMSVDTNCYENNNPLIIQEFTDKGVGETFLL